MRVKSIRLKNFKRFTDVLIRDIPSSAKLVVVVGPNGSGKSSLFDAMLNWYRQKTNFGINADELYYRKDRLEPFGWPDSVEVELHGTAVPTRGSLYVRTAYRNDPDFSVTGFSRPTIPSDTLRFNRVIENDQTVSENYQRLVYDTTAAVYEPSNDAKLFKLFVKSWLGRFASQWVEFLGIFDDEVLESLVISTQKQHLLADVLKIKADAIINSMARGNPADDLKSAAGDIYTKLKQLLALQRAGNNSDAFMRDTLAPLVVPGMSTYQILKTGTVDRIV